MVRLSGEGSLEDQLKAAVPDWQQTLCGSHQQGHARCLIVSAGAVSALDMMKQLPNFNEVSPGIMMLLKLRPGSDSHDVVMLLSYLLSCSLVQLCCWHRGIYIQAMAA